LSDLTFADAFVARDARRGAVPAPGPVDDESSLSRGELVYLASQSPRRRQLLDQIASAMNCCWPRADEDAEALEAERSGELPLTTSNA